MALNRNFDTPLPIVGGVVDVTGSSDETPGMELLSRHVALRQDRSFVEGPREPQPEVGCEAGAGPVRVPSRSRAGDRNGDVPGREPADRHDVRDDHLDPDRRALRGKCCLSDSGRHGAKVPRGLEAPGAAAPGRGRFGRMFPQLPAGDLGADAIEALAKALRGPSGNNPGIPAGYTYLAQFIDHDITFDPTSQLEKVNDPHALVNFRTPRLDLDSVYGSGPADQPFLYEWTERREGQAARSKLVGTDARPAAQRTGPRADRRPAQRREPHPRAAAPAVHPLPQQGRRPRPRAHGSRRRGAVRRGAAHRALALPVDRRARLPAAHRRPSRWRTRCSSRPSAGSTGGASEPFIPVEFSGAAYRFGHSMVRNDYRLNAELGRRRDPRLRRRRRRA